MSPHVWIWLVLTNRLVIAAVEHYHFTNLYHIQNNSSQNLPLVQLTGQATLMKCAQSVLKHPQQIGFSYNKKNKACVTSDCWAMPVQAQEDTGNICYFKQDPKCPRNFVRHEKSCYWFSRTEENHDSARSKCKLLGGDLAKITTKEEHDFIRSTATSRSYYVGATDLRLGGKWAWEGEATEIAYSDWAPGEPNGASEHCMDLFKGYDYKMNDTPCRTKLNFICEQPAKF